MAMRAQWAAIAILVSVASFAAPAAGAQSPDAGEDKPLSFEEAHAAYLERTDLQLSHPKPEEPPPRRERSEPPGWIEAISTFFGNIIEAIAGVIGYIGLAILFGLVGWLLWFIFGEAISARFGRTRTPRDVILESEVDDMRPDPMLARSLLEEADALARDGRFAEAVHLLLFRSIEDIRARKGGVLAKSLTAREIGGLGDLPERGRAALAPIIRVVERSFFGGRDVDGEGWKTARSSYEQFAFGGAPNG
ncbi:MAG: hypothetical protein AAF486_00085 [Pseudomonadota bacterium]